MASAINMFLSYAHKDEQLRYELEKQLVALKRQNIINIWYDRAISAGGAWEQKISEHLDDSQIILLLISPDFMHSDYCYGVEMKRALEKHALRESIVIPVILRPTDWRIEPLKKLQVLPTDARPVTLWHNRDAAFLDIARGIRQVIAELPTNTSANFSATLTSNLKETGQAIQQSSLGSPVRIFEEGEIVSNPSVVQLPEPIRQYLVSYPMFCLPEDIHNSFVCTSAESFYLQAG
jgi:hypothetical protein